MVFISNIKQMWYRSSSECQENNAKDSLGHVSMTSCHYQNVLTTKMWLWFVTMGPSRYIKLIILVFNKTCTTLLFELLVDDIKVSPRKFVYFFYSSSYSKCIYKGYGPRLQFSEKYQLLTKFLVSRCNGIISRCFALQKV